MSGLAAALSVSIAGAVAGTPPAASAQPAATGSKSGPVTGHISGHMSGQHSGHHAAASTAASTTEPQPTPKPTPEGYVDPAGPRPYYVAPTTLRPRQPAAGQRLSQTATDMPSVSPGSWRVEDQLDRIVHIMELPTFQAGTDPMLACRGSGNLPASGPGGVAPRFVCFRYDRLTHSKVEIPLPDDWFCMDAIPDADGNMRTTGGTGAYPAQNTQVANTWAGTKSSYIYHHADGHIERLGDMNAARWYPTMFANQDDDMYVMGGIHNGGAPKTWEVMRHGTKTWQVLPGIAQAMWSYSDLQLIGADTFAYNGAAGSANKISPYIIDMRTMRRTVTPGLRDVGVRRAASALLTYPGQNERVMVFGGVNGAGTTATDHVDMIDYSTWPTRVPSFVPRASLPLPMTFVNVVNLPNGQIFATGGSKVWRSGDVLWAGFYDQDADRWTMVTPPTIGRDYHTTVKVNLDGTVSVLGGNPTGKVFHSEIETYSPWYTEHPRPELDTTTLSREMTIGGTYPLGVKLPEGATLGDITLDHQRALTHGASDPVQGMFQVPFTVAADGSVSLTVPSSDALTAGMYKLTAVTADGVPSVSVWVHLNR